MALVLLLLLVCCSCSWRFGVGVGVQLGELSTVEARLVTLEDKLLGLRDLLEAELLRARPPGVSIRERSRRDSRSLDGALTGRDTASM